MTAIIPTRGDVDLAPVLAALPYGEVIVWDNSQKATDAKVYGRYLAAREASNELVYVQDDDCVIRGHDRLLEVWRPGAIAANMKRDRLGEYHDHCLIGWGAIFERDLPERAHERYLDRWPADRLFLEVACDIVFTMLTPFVAVAAAVEDLPYATAGGRTSTTAEWAGQKAEATRRARQLANQS